MLTAFYKSRLGLAIETFFLTILPLIFLIFYPSWVHDRTRMIMGALGYGLVFALSQKIDHKKLGLQIANFLPAAKALIRPTLLAIALTYVFFYFWRDFVSVPLLVTEVKQLPSLGNLALRYLFVSAPIQELYYRSYLINRAEYIFATHWFVRGYSAVIFMLLHIAVNNIFLTIGTLILGWIWAGHFLKHHNIFPIILSHWLIGMVYLFLMVS